MFPVDIDIRNFSDSSRTLKYDVFRIAAGLGSMKEPLTESINSVVTKSIAMNFLMGGRPKWKSLTEGRIRARGSAQPILIDKNTLLRAAVSKTIWSISDTEANMNKIEGRVPYAKYHQDGTSKMPQRQFAILQPRDVDEIVNIFDRWIGSVARDEGRWPS